MTQVPTRDATRRRRPRMDSAPTPSVASDSRPSPSNPLSLTASLIRAAIAADVETLGGNSADLDRIAGLAAYAIWIGSAATVFGP
jgi:hypothetical protein